MTINDQIKNDLKAAMIAKDEAKVGALRMAIAALRNREIEEKQRDGLADDLVREVLASEIKKRRDSIEAYAAGGREDLADRERAEIAIISAYLPQMTDEAEIRAAVKELLATAAPAAFGPLMGQVMAKLRGKADGTLIAKIVKELSA